MSLCLMMKNNHFKQKLLLWPQFPCEVVTLKTQKNFQKINHFIKAIDTFNMQLSFFSM